MKKLELHPEIFIIKDFLKPAECTDFINKGEDSAFEEAKVNIDGKQVTVKGIRNNQRLLFSDEFLAQDLWNKVKPFVPATFGVYEAIGLNELFRIYKYTEGQRFKMHRDGSYERNEKECSFFSFLIYLNDGYIGGETHFENGITISPTQGDALLFYHPLKHEGKPIISGTKYVLRTDIMYRLL